MEKNIAIVNIYNFIRKTVYPSGEFVSEELEAVLYEIEEVKRYGFPATYALKYDALMDENYIKLLNENLDENDEIGCWWEIDQTLANKAFVDWKGANVVDDHVNKGYSLAYTPEERIRMIDVYMEDFKSIFGYYPKTVGSWVIDIVSLKYLKEKYNIEGAAICRDQLGTDGFTLSGGYYNQAYYPSLVNEFIPAQTKANQLDLPIFRLLGADPIYAFEDGLRKSISGVYTLEPAATIAQDEDWVKWFFERQLKESTIGFSYVQTGQENTYLWDTMSRGYELQMKHLSAIEKEHDIRIETLSESSRWYKRKYTLTPITTLSATEDWNKEENLKTLWYNSRFYRISFLFEDSSLMIRDLHLFNEHYKSRYYEEVLMAEESIFDALPVLDAHHFSHDEKRAKIEFLQLDELGNVLPFQGEQIEFKKINHHDYRIKWGLNNGSLLTIICKENTILIEIDQQLKGSTMILTLNECPVLIDGESNILNFTHNQFDYTVWIDQGEVIKIDDFKCTIASNHNRIELRFGPRELGQDQDFFSDEYKLKGDEIDHYLPKYKRNPSENKVIKRAIKPIIIPKIALKRSGEFEIFTIENKNGAGEIYYSLDGSTPTKDSFLYTAPIQLTSETTIKAKVFVKGMKESIEDEANLYQYRPIKYITAFTSPVDIERYNPNGIDTLIDGVKGTKNYRDGSWLGYHKDLDVMLDLEQVLTFNQITVGFLQDTRAWIYYPKDILFQGSIDGINFEDIEYINIDYEIPRREIAVENIQIKKEMNYRYLKVLARNQSVCPEWSILPGEGPTFLFIDQISIL